MEGKIESHDHSFEDFKPQKVNKKIKHEKKTDSKGNSKSLFTKDSSCNETIVENTTASTCVVCNDNIERNEMEKHLSSCMEKYKHSKGKEVERKSATGKRKEQLCCFLCNQILSSLSFQQREEHVNKCLNKQEAKRKWKELGLNENRKKPKTRTIMDCPVCGQSFVSSEARHSHLKTCSMKHNMSPKQLIEAVRLQEKHAKEWKDAGLLPVTSSSSRTMLRKSTRPKQFKPQQPKDKNEEDLQTALALSASLSECMNNKRDKELDSEHSEDIDLQFTSSTKDRHVMRLHSHQEQKTIKKKTLKPKATPALLQRTEEERIKLLEERVSNLLGAEMPVCCLKYNYKDTTKEQLKRCTISDRTVHDRSLLTLSSQKDVALDDFYVLSLRDLVSPSKVEAGSKLRRLSQLPGSSLTQKLPVCTSLQYNEIGDAKNDISTQECIDFILEDDDDILGKDESKKTEIGGFCLQKEEYSLPLEQNNELNPNIKSSLKLALAFRSLVCKEDYSDISIITDNGEKHIPAHGLILNVRCPDIMKDVKLSYHKGAKPFIDWKEICSDDAVAFLEVIYSGNTFSPLSNEDHVKKLISRYNAQSLFQDLQIFLEMESKQSKSEKNERKELNDILNGIWQNSDIKEPFQNNTAFAVETQGNSDIEDLENVYLYLSQKQGKGEQHRCKEANKEEEICDILENSYSTNDDSICVTQEDTINNNSKLCSELSTISGSTNGNNAIYELPVMPKKSSTKMARYSSKSDYSEELFDGESDIEMKLSRSINKLQSIDLKEENQSQRKSSNTFSSLEDSPYHFSEEDNYHHEKYSSPTKRFGRKKHLEFTSKFDIHSPVKSPFKKGETKQPLLGQQGYSSNNTTPTKTHCIRSKYSPKKTQEKGIYNSPTQQTKNTSNSVFSYNSPGRAKALQSQSQCVRMQPLLKPLPVKCKEMLNNSQKNESFEENDIHYDAWDDFNDNGYNEFLADMIDSNFDNEDIKSQISENMLSPPEVATNSFLNEAEKNYELPTPSPCKGKNFLPSNKKKKDSSPWKENGVKDGSPVKKKAHTCNKSSKVKNNVTPMPNYNQMITPKLKEYCAKYGVKKLPRKKAVAVLTHLYEETHPFVTDSEYDTTVTSTPVNQSPSFVGECDLNSSDKKQGHCKEAKSRRKKKLKQLSQMEGIRTNLSQKMNEYKETKKNVSDIKCSQQNSSDAASVKEIIREEDIENSLKDADLDDQPSSQASCQSETSDMLEESLIPEMENNSTDGRDVHKRLQSFIQQNVELYERILKYEPIDLTEFHKRVRESGIKVSIAGLMDFFDEECITFSNPRDEKTKEKQKKRSKRYQKRRAAAIAKQEH